MKGQRGGKRPNSGRKTKDEEQKISLLMSPYVPGAIDTILNVMNTAKFDSDKLAAAKIILEYAFGKPKQAIDAVVNGGFTIDFTE